MKVINNKLANWLLNEVRFILNKYKITWDEYATIYNDIDLLFYVLMDSSGRYNHNYLRDEFYKDFEIKYKLTNKK